MLNIYLSGEIHTDWREEIIHLCKNENLNISFSSPITNHGASDNCGVEILGQEEKNFWKDSKGANINSIKTRKAIKDADIVIWDNDPLEVSSFTTKVLIDGENMSLMTRSKRLRDRYLEKLGLD